MARGRIENRNTVFLDGTYYRIKNPVQKFITSQFPAKITIGDQTPDSHPLSSNWRFSGDARGGIGVEILDPTTDADRVFYTTGQIRFKNHLVMPRLPTQTAAGSAASDVGVIGEINNVVYASYGTAVDSYDNSTDVWSNERSIAANATDVATGLVGGTNFMIIANGTDIDYVTEGGSWAENTTQPIKYLFFWRDRLWGITQAGRLYWTNGLVADAGAMWTADAQLQLPDDHVTSLLTGPSPSNEEVLYAGTKVGLFVHDVQNTRFLRTSLEVPFHPDGGKGTQTWRGAIYFAAGNAVYKYVPTATQTIVTIVGPDRDGGLPDGKRGAIRHMETSHTDLIIALDASSAASALSMIATRGVGTHHGFTTPSLTGFSSVLGWDERGWEVKWLGSETARPISWTHVSNAYNEYNLWFAENQRVTKMSLPKDIVNPSQVTDMTFDSRTTQWESPWLDTESSNETWTAIAAYLKTTNPTTSETVKLEYAVDYETSYTDLTERTGPQDTAGDVKYLFPDNELNGAEPSGKTFKAIKFRMTLARGSTNTNSPDVIKGALSFKKNLDVAFGFSFIIDMTEGTAYGESAGEALALLQATIAKQTLYDFTFRDDDGEDRNYWVTLTNYASLEETGHEQVGQHQVQVSEVL